MKLLGLSKKLAEAVRLKLKLIVGFSRCTIPIVLHGEQTSSHQKMTALMSFPNESKALLEGYQLPFLVSKDNCIDYIK